MKKLLMITPHCSTGGLPQYLLKQIESFVGEYDIYCIEYMNISGEYIVQKNKIKNILDAKFITLGDDKKGILDIIKEISPDIIHFQEIPQSFVDSEILDILYDVDRKYKIVVTTHSSYTDPSTIKYTADSFVLVSDWSRRIFANFFSDIPCSVWEYPIEVINYNKNLAKSELNFDKTQLHILHVGLFTPGKNQKAIVELAKLCLDQNITFHFVGNQAGNFREYWEPIMLDFPKNCIWHGERSDVDKFYKACDVFYFPSLFELNPISIKEAIGYGLEIFIKHLNTYENMYDDFNYISDDIQVNKDSILKLNIKRSIYDDLCLNSDILYESKPIFNINFINGPFFEVTNSPGDIYKIEFIDKDSGLLHHSGTLTNNTWIKANKSYFINWRVVIYKNNEDPIFHDMDFKNKKVFISLESKSIGDTIAWMPYIDEFRKKWDCEVICSTFWNQIFKNQYNELTFVQPGSSVGDIYARYSIGLFYNEDGVDYNRNKIDPLSVPLLKISSDILGIDYKEIRAKLPVFSSVKKKQVSIAIHSTAQIKYWNNNTGWQEVVDFLKNEGYDVILISKEENGYMGNFEPNGVIKLEAGPIETVIKTINESEFFIGISSGLSWLAWATNTPVVLISGFTDEILEPQDNVIRIINKRVCHGCWSRHRFDPGDWNWCPDQKDTPRQFECSKNITGSMVIEEIKKNLL